MRLTQGLVTIALGLGWALPGLGAAPGGRVGQSLIAFRPALVMRGVLIGDPASIGTYSTKPMAQSRRQTRPLRNSFSPVASAVRTCRCGPVKLMVEIMALGLGWRSFASDALILHCRRCIMQGGLSQSVTFVCFRRPSLVCFLRQVGPRVLRFLMACTHPRVPHR